MADAYATLANGGVHHDPTAISRVEFPNGKVDQTVDNGAGDRVLTAGPGLGRDRNCSRA